MSDLITKYRPASLQEMKGHTAIVKQLNAALEKKTSRVFLLVGETGAGKTTLARIIATMVGATGRAVQELDAATNNSIDDMRHIIETMQFRPMGTASPNRVIILDEVHALSRQAWTSLLKTVEEPPHGVYLVFCTTELAKVPDNIRTRCTIFQLKPVGEEDLLALLQDVNKKEGITESDEVLHLISEKAQGSPRRALSMLSKCVGVKTRKRAAELLATSDGQSEDDPVIQLCRDLAKGTLVWSVAQKHLEALKGTNPESVRMVVLAYFEKMFVGAKDEKRAQSALAVIDAFSQPYYSSTGIWPVGLSLGRLMW